MSVKNLKITLVRSPIGIKPKHKLALQTLGLRSKLNRSVLKPDNPAVRGLIRQVNYLLKVEENAE